MPQLLIAFITLPHFSLTDKHCIPSKCSLSQKYFRESQPACKGCSLPDEEVKGMKVTFLASFQDKLKPVV